MRAIPKGKTHSLVSNYMYEDTSTPIQIHVYRLRTAKETQHIKMTTQQEINILME